MVEERWRREGGRVISVVTWVSKRILLSFLFKLVKASQLRLTGVTRNPPNNSNTKMMSAVMRNLVVMLAASQKMLI
jgi:hypothetical protein